LIKTMSPPPIKIWQDVGTMDWLITSNRQFHTLLQKRGFDVTYHEYSAGHNYPAWRDALPQALMTLFAPNKG
jgi:enterochelin esterase-like enzyme